MSAFSLLWSKILESSLWIKETKETRIVWITMLAMRDANGVVEASIVGLADRGKVTVEECRSALTVLLSPDPDDTSKVEGGRRIREIEGGWQIVNHDRYRFSTAAKREHWKLQKAEQRQRESEDLERRKNRLKSKNTMKKQAGVSKSPNEIAYVKAEQGGATDGELDKIVSDGLPPWANGEEQK